MSLLLKASVICQPQRPTRALSTAPFPGKEKQAICWWVSYTSFYPFHPGGSDDSWSGHSSHHTRFMTRCTPGGDVHREDFPPRRFQGFAPRESGCGSIQGQLARTRWADPSVSPTTGAFLPHKLVIGNIPCGHGMSWGRGSWRIYISSPIGLLENVDSLALSEGWQPKSASAEGLRGRQPVLPQRLPH